MAVSPLAATEPCWTWRSVITNSGLRYDGVDGGPRTVKSSRHEVDPRKLRAGAEITGVCCSIIALSSGDCSIVVYRRREHDAWGGSCRRLSQCGRGCQCLRRLSFRAVRTLVLRDRWHRAPCWRWTGARP